MEKCYFCGKDYEPPLLTEYTIAGVQRKLCSRCCPGGFRPCLHCGVVSPARTLFEGYCPVCVCQYFVRCCVCDSLIRTETAVALEGSPGHTYHCCQRHATDGQHIVDESWSQWGYNHVTEYSCRNGGRTKRMNYERSGPTYGVEFELSGGHVGLFIADIMRVAGSGDTGSFWSFKRDGSVPDGIEVVTSPFSYLWAKHNREAFEPLWAAMEKRGMSGKPRSCSTHIHISKDSFSALGIYKLLRLFNNQTTFAYSLGQRNCGFDHFNRYSSCNPLSELSMHSGAVLKSNLLMRADRHRAINISPGTTIELRMFGGCTGKERFLEHLRTARAILEYCEAASVIEVGPANFCDWLEEKHNGAFVRPLFAKRLKHLIPQWRKASCA